MRDTSPSSCRAHRDISLVLVTRYNVFLDTARVSQSSLERNLSEHVDIRDRRRYFFPGKRRTSPLSVWTLLKAGKAFLASSFQNRPLSLFIYTSRIGKLTANYAGGSQYSGSPNHSRKDGGSRSRGHKNTVTSEESKQGRH